MQCILHCISLVSSLVYSGVDVGYVNANYTENESVGTAQVCVSVTGATLARDVIVTVSTVMGGTATGESLLS